MKNQTAKNFSLVIGRFQCIPPHKGHLSLINKLLEEGKNVQIGLRRENDDGTNPFSRKEREEAFDEIYKEEIDNGTVKIVWLEDITEVVHGRKVGWSVRQIKLPKEIESISGTEVRNASL